MARSADPRPERPPLERDFREAMRHVAAPVSVVTACVDGTPHGTTVSAFDSLSMDPPLMTVALQRSSRLLALVAPGTRLGVNVLSSTQASLAMRFARAAADRFAGLDWTLLGGAPRLPRVHAWIGLEVRSLVPAGDHVVVIGAVVAAEAGTGRPLTYHDRLFGTHLPHPVEPIEAVEQTAPAVDDEPETQAS
ncbi:flavin reductase family protein [Terrabacter sp. NPDC080008]|uniref:flavin reductase family protein n=1 Tax=Terrabacter sp. NPDC080008 TaxID=3155176 RepID=UPI00344BB0BA